MIDRDIHDGSIDESIIQVQELPYEKFDRIKFFKQFNIPYDTTLDINNITKEQAREELKKIKNVEDHTGFAYFFLEYCTVSHPTEGSVIIKDNAYKWQIKAALEFLQNRYIVSLKSRQVAFSTTVGAYCLWRALFFDSQRIVIISKNQHDSIVFLERIKFIYEHLPIWLKQGTSEFAKTYVTFAHNFSKITSLPNKGDPAQGESLSLLVADEFASYDDSQAVLNAATPALSAGSMTPFSNKALPSQLFIISTLPRKKVVNNNFLRILHGAQERTESRYKLINVEVDDISYYRDRAWHLEMLETLGPRGYRIEVLKQEVYASENALIEGNILQSIKTKNPIRCDFLYPELVDTEGYPIDLNTFAKMNDNWDANGKYLKGFWVWEDPVPGRQYVIVADVAGGEANDFCAFHVFDPANENNQVAEYRGQINTEEYKDVLTLVCAYYNNAKLSVERNGLGINICQYFGNTINYEGFYWHQKSKYQVFAGFPMVNPIRANAIAFMENMVIRGEVKINSIRLLNELRNFGITSKGRIAAISGPDDLTLALCQFCWLQQIGWAVTDEQAMDSMYGDMNNIKQKTEVECTKERVPVAKYWDDEFDLSDTQREVLAYAKASNMCIDNDFKKILNKRNHL